MNYPIIEGCARLRDISRKYLVQYPDLMEVEKGIPYNEFYYHSHIRNKEMEYRIIKRITESEEHATLLVKNCPITVSLNRYPDILPFRDTVVPLMGDEYINANFIDGTLINSENMFIATQAPLHGTMDAFWTMIWQYDVDLILMICCINESGIKKCEEYFPEEGTLQSASFEISVEKTSYLSINLIQRTFTLVHIQSQESKRIMHLHGKSWPDQGAPNINDEFNSIDAIIQLIKSRRVMNPSCKIAVHCSAGIGRTGLFIGIYNMVVALEELIELDIQNGMNNARVSVFGVTRRLREQRWGMVNSLKQYKFMYKFMEYWITAYLASQATF